MKILRYASESGPRLGVLVGEEVAPLQVPLAPGEGVEVLLGLEPERRRALIEAARGDGGRVAFDRVRLLAPVPRPRKVFAIGLNYADHIAESRMATPEVPTVFAKFGNSVIGPNELIERPRVSTELDYEGELGIVIGTRCRHVPVERADEVIGGFVVVNDVSVRDWQRQSPQWTMGKSFDTHAPIGPWVTLPDGLDAGNLRITTHVNGELRQESTTANLVFGCAQLVAFLSQACTLEPGDIIATGTPAGVGGAMSPPRYLVPGDEVRVEVEGIGLLVNPVADEPSDSGHIGAETLPSVVGMLG